MLPNNTWIIIPAYNEAKTIASVLSELLKVTQNIVVVDDGSQDQTKEIVSQFPVYFLEHEINRGQGAALQTGANYALQKGAQIIVHFDADGQMQVKDIPKMIEPIIDGKAEIVFGSRFLDNKSNIPWTKKYFILKPAILLNWLITGVKLSDGHNGFRALAKTAAQKIEIRQDRMAHATEILEQVRINDLKYTEVPVEIIYHDYGQGFSGGLKILWDLLFSKIFNIFKN